MDVRKSRKARLNTENKCQIQRMCFTTLKWRGWKYFKTLSANENMELHQKTANRGNGVEEDLRYLCTLEYLQKAKRKRESSSSDLKHLKQDLKMNSIY